MIGPGAHIDTNQFFVVCANVLGGCQGSTGPASPHPDDGRPYGSRFPVVTVRDMVRHQEQLMRHLGDRAVGVRDRRLDGRDAGARVGDHVSRSGALDRADRDVHAGQRPADRVGRDRPAGDPSRSRWRGGDYYDAEPGDGPAEGLSIARQVAQVTFRSDNVFTERFGRSLTDQAAIGDTFGLWQEFEVERYLHYHGDKLVRRFDANSYLIIGKAMDLHDVARGRGGLEAAMARIRVPNLTMGISSDFLYPPYQQRQMARMLSRTGLPSSYIEIDSPHGHDAFLIHVDQVGEPIAKFLAQVC